MLVLITCASGPVAHKLKKLLSGKDIILGDYADLPGIMIKAGQILKLPNPGDAAYQHEVLTLCLDKGIEEIYALGKDEQRLLSESKQLFAEYGITVKDIPDDIQ